MKLKIIVDSTFALPDDYVAEKNITVVPLNVIVEGKTYLDEITITLKEVMDYVQSGIRATSSQPSPETYLEAYNQAKKEGFTDIMCLTISSTLSGTYQSAHIAAMDMEGINVWVVDTLTASVGSEIITRVAIEELEKGVSLEEVLAKIEVMKQQGGVMLGMENLHALKLSGRITGIRAAIGNLIRVKPILEYVSGKLHVVSKIRTEGGMIDYILDKLHKELDQVKSRIHIYVSHIRVPERAERIKERIEEVFQNIKVHMGKEVSSVIGVNLGYGGIGVAWCYE